MYQPIKDGFAKIRKDSLFLRQMWLLSDGLILPSQAIQTVATCYFINAVNLLDEALGLYIKANLDGRVPLKLVKKIKSLSKGQKLGDPDGLDQLINARNTYVHDLSAYADWEEMDKALRLIEGELKHLGIL